MKTIYCDMDGVLCNFNARFEQLFKEPASVIAQRRKKGVYSQHWNTFIDSRQFATLDKMNDADDLINYLKSVDIVKAARVSILSSSGGFDRHNTVQIQKRIWLESAGIDWPCVIVPGRRFKAGYADKYSLLIDDTLDIIESFRAQGGTAIHHKDAKSTIEQVNLWLNN
jgi:hypothetical protein